jgi:transglutaminase-like putative cysteine protease
LRTTFTVRKRRIIYFVWVQAFIIAAAVLFCLAAASITALKHDKRRDEPSKADDYSISRQIQYSFTLQNKSNRVVDQAELWTFAPVKQTANQRCVDLQSNYPYRLLTDDSGNQVLHFKFDNLPPYGSRVVTVRADLLVSPAANPLSAGPSPQDVNPQQHIESDHPAITRVARKLRMAEASDTIEKVFRWVTANVRYGGYAAKDRGALFALKYKKADCTEYANLFVALCRANGIAARTMGGYVSAQSSVLRARDYHNWGEFYENGTWKVADPQNHVLTKSADNYLAMRIIHPSEDDPMGPYNRFRLKGEGLMVRMN